MIARERLTSPSVWESSGERLRVQFRKRPLRSEKFHSFVSNGLSSRSTSAPPSFLAARVVGASIIAVEHAGPAHDLRKEGVEADRRAPARRRRWFDRQQAHPSCALFLGHGPPLFTELPIRGLLGNSGIRRARTTS